MQVHDLTLKPQFLGKKIQKQPRDWDIGKPKQISNIQNIKYQIFISDTTSTSIWCERVQYHRRNSHFLKELPITMVCEPIIRCYGHSSIILNSKQQTGDGNWMTNLSHLLCPTKKSHQNH